MAAPVFELIGDIDLAAEVPVRAAMEQFLADAKGEPVYVVDAKRAGFVDSTALGLLEHLREKARAQGASVTIRNADDRLLEILKITGVHAGFGFDPPQS